MSLIIEVAPEIEATLASQAEARGIPLSIYLREVLERQAAADTANALSPAERAAIWRASVKYLPHTPPLSDEAISRERLYDANDRG